MTITKLQLPNYQVIEQIYDSNKTVVYRGICSVSQKPVIIKLLKEEYPTFNEIAKFRNQYTIAKNLDIKGVVKPLALETYGNRLGLIMDDDGSISLSEELKSRENHFLSLGEFFPLAIQLTKILAGLYKNRIIHKDIKPANIIINSETKQVKLIDFSIASLLPREQQEIQSPNILEGTLAYISPEQTGRMNRGIDYRSDFYSVGVTFYQLLTGKLPFESDDAMELVHCHLARTALPLGERVKGKGEGKNRNSPSVLSDIVMKLMAKNAEERYQSALGLKYDLEKCWQQWQETGIVENFELGERDICDRFTIPEKLYGREKEIKTLLAAFARVSSQAPKNLTSETQNSKSELILVAGFSGIGKTAVVKEVHKPIVEKRGYFIEGKFDQFQRNIAFSAFVQAFRDLMEQLLGESDIQLQRWRKKILAALGDNGQVIIDVIPELESIIGPQLAVAELAGTATQNRFNLLFSKFIQVFTTPEHPLVIFLDDLQWADSASLQLIQVLTSATESGYLLLIGAYRDNEVSPTHPLMLTLGEIEKKQTPVSTITLPPLNSSQLNHLVADSLSCSGEFAQPLTDLVERKTQGNPFFVNQFLKALFEEELITFQSPQSLLHEGANQGGWQYNIERLKAEFLTDDVVQFMALQIKKLPQASQEALKLAACIGNQFPLDALAIVLEKSVIETATDLWPALQDGLLLPQDEAYKSYQDDEYLEIVSSSQLPNYKFLHDRIQQAAYSLIPENCQQATHLQIGRLLLDKTPLEKREEILFDIVNQLNQGKQLLDDPLEKEHLSQLNLLAGRKVKASTAYAAACDYIATGTELLAEDSWESQYELTFALYKERGEVEYLNGNFSEAKHWLDLALEKAKTPLEKAELYNLSIIQYTLQANYPQAIEAGRQALSLLGVDLPRDDFETVRDAEIAITQNILQRQAVNSLAEMPVMSDPEKKMATKILIAIGPPTYRSHQRLWSVICAKGMNLCLQYGNAPQSGYIYPAYGGLRGFALNDYQNTGDLVAVTLQVMEQFNNPSADSVAYLMIGSSIRHWCYPLKVASQDYQTSYQIGLESSNLQYAAYAFGHNMYCRFYQGIPLEQLAKEVSKYQAFSGQQKNKWAIDLLAGGQHIIAELQETTAEFKETEKEYLERCIDHKNWQVICIYSILKTYFLFLLGCSQEALQWAEKAEAEIINVAPQGLLPYSQHRFIYALVLASMYPQAATEEKVKYRKQLQTYYQQLKIWAENCPANFSHGYELVGAEIARIDGDILVAIENYDKAIAAAKEQEFWQYTALANELAAKFYLDWGKETIAQTYMIEAYYCYSHWGAKAKVKHLEKTYPQILALILRKSSSSSSSYTTLVPTSSNSTSTSVLDLTAAVKASQVLSGETRLDALLSKLMQIVLENAGADKAALILNNTKAWEVVAQCNSGVYDLSPTPLEDTDFLPLSVIRAVKRTQERVSINEVARNRTFAGDTYLIQKQPQSLFCTPIINQGRFIGILYLENNLTIGAFSADRVEILNLLCSQAAISLENAQLYQTLEEKVEERTRELEAAQQQIISQEKLASLGALTAGVAHELRNPLNFVTNYAEGSVEMGTEVLAEFQEEQQPPNQEDWEYIKETITDLKDNSAAIQKHAQRAENIIHNMMQHACRDDSSRQMTNINKLLEEARQLTYHSKRSGDDSFNITFATKYDEFVEELEVFSASLSRAFINIIENGCYAAWSRYKEEGESFSPQLWITSKNLEKEIEICIRDNGKGIPNEVKEKLFEPFFTTKPTGEGTGLGLSLTHEIIVGQHGGTLKVNTEPGSFTEFIIALPQNT